MSNNIYAGRVPLNYRQGTEDVVAKSTSYRPGQQFNLEVRNQYNDRTIAPRNPGCEVLRRYPNGTLDYKYVAHKIIEVIHKIKDRGFVTEIERACLSMILPQQFGQLMDGKIAQTITKLSIDERMMLAALVDQHMKEELNWNAGLGGGSVPGRSSTRS